MRSQLADAIDAHQRVVDGLNLGALTAQEQAATWSVILEDQQRLLQLALRIGDRFPDEVLEGRVRSALRRTFEKVEKLQKLLSRNRLALVRSSRGRKKSSALAGRGKK